MSVYLHTGVSRSSPLISKAYPYTGPNHTSSILVDFSPENWPRLVALWNATADASCVASARPPSACMLANYSLPYISSDVFIVEAQTDKVCISAATR
jgi:hypothetical protein